MQDLDLDASQKFSPPLEEILRHPKDVVAPPQPHPRSGDDEVATAPSVTSAPVPVPVAAAPGVAPVRTLETGKKTPVVAVAEVGGEDEDDSEDETGSEYGELSMVEPEPLDDNDYGLM